MRFLSLLPLFAACLSQASAGSHLLVEGGVTKAFVLDCTTLRCRPIEGEPHFVFVGDQRDESGIVAEAQRLERRSEAEFDLCLFEQGRARSEGGSRSLVRKIRVCLVPGGDPHAIALAAGASAFSLPSYAPDFLILTFPDPGDSLTHLDALRRLPGVAAADPLLARKKFPRLIPDDPKFTYSPGSQAYQWHLRNSGQNGSSAGFDVNVTDVWDSLRGQGITIAIVDDGLEVSHPDLAANVDTLNDHDWNDATPDDPTPQNSFDEHGTSCAGVAAARGNNGIGVSGAAPEASLVGLRLIASDTTDEQDAEAIAWKTDVIDISSNSWGPDDDGRDFFVAEPLISAAFAHGVATGRGGRGTIYVWAGGNGREAGDYSNYDGYNNHSETISVAAIAADGRQARYSESGANLVVCAPSDNEFGDPAITTTTLTVNGSYTDDFGGTSSVTPLVSGVIALILQQNPELGWRDVQEILLRSARMVDPADPGWAKNGAGFDFNHRYGAGMIDAGAAVELADGWSNLGAQRTAEFASGALDLVIPDNDDTGLGYAFDVGGAALRVEHAQLTVDIDHSSRGNLEISLVSPSGTVSQFSEEHGDRNDHIRNYTFLSVRHWGEDSLGAWTVRVADQRSGDVGTLRSLSLRLFGTSEATGYELWASEQIDAGKDRSPAGDVERDGRSNLLEYALGSDPQFPAPTRNSPRLSAAGFEFEMDTSKTDITYLAESSTDLVTWSLLPTEVIAVSGTIETRRSLQIDANQNRIHYRLKVQGQE